MPPNVIWKDQQKAMAHRLYCDAYERQRSIINNGYYLDYAAGYLSKFPNISSVVVTAVMEAVATALAGTSTKAMKESTGTMGERRIYESDTQGFSSDQQRTPHAQRALTASKNT
jgi:hypothetical protein